MSTESPQKAKVILYWLEKSRSQRILWLLEELKIDYELKVFKRTEKMVAPPELKEVHPLGKSPVIGVHAPGAERPRIIAESGLIVEYLTEYFGKWLEPKKFAEGKEGHIGGESEEWLRYRFFMHYAEGSLMTLMLVAFLMHNIETAPVPFFIKPITRGIVGKMNTAFLHPNFKTHLDFLEDQLATSPNGGEFLCGPELTGADIMMIFPLEAAQWRAGLTKEKYPRLAAYIERLQQREAFQRAIKKIEDVTGEKYTPSLSK
ncbi:bifunctional glutathione transferase/peroxidase [Coniosporium apollinis]|uniref:Bifunctional glutathione transferase/peroxidase n=2 Tax=Coniosporium TaxID=2810619 RepID=A0ABQ9NTB4_9PEZI|nr:bifunctional glutathione transferase/peroxidase [Cladosporium sp. JES 115]KAJ9664104.1 bifunctional glutathione transferase/peroxidase [Coniosporium apollinis]